MAFSSQGPDGGQGLSVWFRVDEHAGIGSGHAMRCFALACELQRAGARVAFAFTAMGEGFRRRLARAKIECVQLSSGSEVCSVVADARALRNALVTAGATPQRCVVVVDVYALDATWHRIVRPWVGGLCVIDDLSNRDYECELLVDQTFGKSAREYLPRVSATCQLCIGVEYALLREQFRNREARRLRPQVQEEDSLNVLLTLGGVDQDNATRVVLEALAKTSCAGRLNVTVLLGALNPHEASLAQCLTRADFRQFELKRDIEDVAEELLLADLCVSAAGSTLWECCALGVPTVAIQTADNQSAVVGGLVAAEAVVGAGRLSELEPKRLSQQLEELLGDREVREGLGARARGICDGQGTARVSRAILELLGA